MSEEKSLAKRAFETIVLTFISTMTLAFFSTVGFIAVQMFEITSNQKEILKEIQYLKADDKKITKVIAEEVHNVKLTSNNSHDLEMEKPEQTNDLDRSRDYIQQKAITPRFIEEK